MKPVSLTVSNGHCTIDEITRKTIKEVKQYWKDEYTVKERKKHIANIRVNNTIVQSSLVGSTGFIKLP
ncbi:hypothetical protein [Vibrio phage vB_VpS_PG28]|nr:hypothetical protein [Vibrio phage vB_VpS_PG28]